MVLIRSCLFSARVVSKCELLLSRDMTKAAPHASQQRLFIFQMYRQTPKFNSDNPTKWRLVLIIAEFELRQGE